MNKLITSLLLMALSSMAFAQPTIKAVEVDPPPVIDGDLSDECWQKATSLSDFYFTSDGSSASEPTSALVCYDQKNIYVAFRCQDSQPQTIQSQQKKRGGGTYTDDYVDFYIACFPTQGHVARFLVTAGGCQLETFDWADTSKIEWRGDWTGAAKLVSDGYTVEMAVPFSILQYRAGQTSLGLCFERHIPRLDRSWISPNIGPTGGYAAWYLWDGLALPRPNLKPKVMAYSVAATGNDDAPQRMGLDIKHSLTPSLTGLVTVNPFFDDVEQQVEGIDFTYNERYRPDSRPFFQEGQGYFPFTNILYTSRIGDIDAGAKVYGKMGDYSLAFMNAQRFGREGYTCLQTGREFGHDRSLYACAVHSHVAGNDHLATLISSGYTFIDKPNRKLKAYAYTINAHEPSKRGALFDMGLDSISGARKLSWGVYYGAIGSDYDPYLSYTPENDLRSLQGGLSLYDAPSDGPVSYWSTNLWGDLTDHANGSLFHKNISLSGTIRWRNGSGGSLGLRSTHRPPNKDRRVILEGWWGQKSLFNNGYIRCSFGRQAGGAYLDYHLGRGWNLGDRMNLRTDYEFSRIRPPSPDAYSAHQLISTLAYDLDNERTLAGRLVAEHGKTNFYLAYKQRVRSGMDAYVIFGDPNADSTRSSFALKLVSLL